MSVWFNATTVRGILPVAAIAGAVLYGLNGMLLEPQEARLAEVRSRYAEAYRTAAANGTLRLERNELKARLSNSRKSVVEAVERSRPAADQRELFEGVTAIAHDSGLELEQLRALDWRPKANAAGTEGACVASACAISLVGTYDDLRTFVGQIETRLGFSSVTRLHVQPATEGNRVRVELELMSVAADAQASAAARGAVANVMEEGQ